MPRMPGERPSVTDVVFVSVGFVVSILAAILNLVVAFRFVNPGDVSGAIFGGAMAAGAALMGWLLALACIVWLVLWRLPGCNLALLATAAGDIGYGVAARAHPLFGSSEYLGNTREESGMAIFAGLVLLALGFYLWLRRTRKGGSGLHPFRFTKLRAAGLAVMLMVQAAVTVPMLYDHLHKRPDLPPCAHDEQGRQLTLCLKPYVPAD